MAFFSKSCTFFPFSVKKEKVVDFFFSVMYHITEARCESLNIKYDINKLKKIIDDICALTGLCMAILDTKENYLYSNGREKSRLCAGVQKSAVGRARCSCSDRDMISRAEDGLCPVSHICHAGLRDTVVPILRYGILAGYIVIGRVRPTESPAPRTDYSELNMTSEEYDLYYRELPYLSEESFDGLIDLLSHILFENAIEVDYDKFINAATDYIEKNLHTQITVEALCRELYISKNLLYKKFRSFFNCTVNEYITAKRLERAKALLDTLPDSSRKVAEMCGFDNYTYFSKLFKRKNGMSVREYRATK